MTELELARIACEEAKKRGADQADAVASLSRRLVVNIEKNSIKSTELITNSGISVRAFNRGGMGFSSSQDLSAVGAVESARMAAEVAEAAEPDPDFKTLPAPEEIPQRDLELFDPSIHDLDLNLAVRMAVEAVDAAREIAPDVMLQGDLVFREWSYAIASSLGVRASARGTLPSAAFFAVIRRGDDVGSDGDGDGFRFLKDLDPSYFAAEATRSALRFLGARSIPTASMPVVLGHRTTSYLAAGVAQMLNAESAQRKRSFLAGRKGQKVASEIFTLSDNPLLPRGEVSALFDGEGMPHRPMNLIENGILKTYIHNSYTANKGGEPNTCHATRGGYGSATGIGATNIIVPLGKRTQAQIIGDIKLGLFIEAAGLSPNPVSGEFSESVDLGFMIENGEITYPVKNAMIGGNILDVLLGIEEFSSAVKRYNATDRPAAKTCCLAVSGGG